MSILQTVQHDVGSLFQSLAEDVAGRMAQRRGGGATAVPGARPGLEHPVIAAAAHVAKSWAEGTIPTRASLSDAIAGGKTDASRSEERRVGKECS